MFFKSFSSFTSLIICFTFVLIFSLCVFIPYLSKYGYVAGYVPDDNYTNSFDISPSGFVWPTPRLYNHYF